ncbi:MAG: hypothetical protein V3U72_02010, partial [Candidatus Aenigmarchaeota archaeon]
CPGDTLSFVVTLTNNDDTQHTYSVFLEAPEGWFGLPDPHGGKPESLGKTLASGERGNMTVYITPPVFQEPGEYNRPKIVVTSGNERWEQPLTIKVLECHDVSLEVDEMINICENSKFKYSFRVTNNGKYSENFEITVSSSWDGKDLYKDSITIESGEIMEIVLNVTSPAEDGRITVKAESEVSYAKDEKYTELNVKKCYDFDLGLEPAEASTCLGGSSRFMLIVTNLGTASDTYEIRTPDWVVPIQENVIVLPGEEKSVELFAYPELEGKTSFDVTLSSKNYPELKKTVTGNVEVRECGGVTVIVSPASQEICKGLPAQFKVTLKNTGMVSDSYGLETNLGALEKNKVSIEPGEIEEIKLTVRTDGLEIGENLVTVTGTSEEISDQNTVSLITKNCYSVDFGVSPGQSEVCRGDEINYTLALKNIGEFEDNYTFVLEDEEIGSASFEPNELKMFSTKLKVDFQEGEYNLTFKVLSEHTSGEAVSTVVVKAEEMCYNVEVSSDDMESRVDPGKGMATGVKVKNTGGEPDNYVLELEGPEWAHLSEDFVSLEGGEETYVYLYVSPGYEAEKKTYDVYLKVKSAKSEYKADFRIGVGVTPEPRNVTGEEPGITIETGIPTGAVVGVAGNTGKVILLAAMVLLIIIILAVKFVLFVK